MRKLPLLIIVLSLIAGNALAQKRKVFKINPGERVVEKIPTEDMYSYPEFVSGRVYLINNTYSVAPMNYNALFGEMQFIDKKGDTLSLADEKKIMLIVVNSDTFYYKDGYLELVLNQGNIKLAKKSLITFVNRQRLGGFGESSQGSIETYGVLSSQSYLKELVANEVITMAKDSVLYIREGMEEFKEVNRKTLQDIYPRNEKDLKYYLKENKVNFKSEEDIKKLVLFFKKIVPVRPL